MSLTPELFSVAADDLVPVAPSPLFDTPLGRLGFWIVLNETPTAPDMAFTTTVGSTVFVWSRATRVELLLTRPVLALPPGLAVTDARAAVWRIRASGSVEGRIRFRCVWSTDATWIDVGPESGENLDAQTWTDGRTKVTVGLPDLGPATAYRRDGFEIAVEPGLAVFQTHFVCAWGPDVPEDVATWFAVDCTPAQALAGTA